MRVILLIRHAKSSWDDSSISDFDRPLNDRGKKDAPEMANRLEERKFSIDRLVSSPAKRARRTAEIFLKELGKNEDELVLKSELYHASPEIFYEVLEQLDDHWHNVALFAHNPGITEFANQLTDAIRVDNIPTCGIFAFRADLNKWKDFRKAKKEFWFFDYPKNSKE
ncbi:MAG: phosphohistidine phosphatase [Bacteroidetes bacterium]|nr:MAG: phosphohistidine phosphatase [Bacteroidota bacterium]